MVHQELNQVKQCNIMDNIWLGRYPKKGLFIDEEKMYVDTRKIFEESDIQLDPRTKVGKLTVSEMQTVEIAKAVSYVVGGVSFSGGIGTVGGVVIEVLIMIIDSLIKDYTAVFGEKEGILAFFAPGRVNLIGEHTDYNGGHVFPCALTLGTYAAVRKRGDRRIRLYSGNFKSTGIIEADADNLVNDEGHDWANYPKGVVKTFKEAGFNIDRGFDILFSGNIPNGAGLSSSASIELATGAALKGLFNLEMGMVEMVKLCQRSENRFNGVNCGIMDQFACGMGKKDHAILLDTNTLEYEYVPVKLEGISIVIANTNKRRGLAESRYNERRSECESALGKLKKVLDISSLGDLTVEEFEEHKLLIGNAVERKRARHAVYENRRTIKAVAALNNGDIKSFGRLMNESHISLRDDYEVTGAELDTLASAAWRNDAIGSRMTGAGFGGCTVSLVKDEKIPEFIEKVGREYKGTIGHEADFYVVSIGDGAKQI